MFRLLSVVFGFYRWLYVIRLHSDFIADNMSPVHITRTALRKSEKNDIYDKKCLWVLRSAAQLTTDKVHSPSQPALSRIPHIIRNSCAFIDCYSANLSYPAPRKLSDKRLLDAPKYERSNLACLGYITTFSRMVTCASFLNCSHLHLKRENPNGVSSVMNLVRSWNRSSMMMTCMEWQDQVPEVDLDILCDIFRDQKKLQTAIIMIIWITL